MSKGEFIEDYYDIIQKWFFKSLLYDNGAVITCRRVVRKFWGCLMARPKVINWIIVSTNLKTAQLENTP